MAQKDHSVRFTSLAHLLTPEYLKESLSKLNRKAAPGIDGMTVTEYWQESESGVQDLHERLKSGRHTAGWTDIPAAGEHLPALCTGLMV